MALETIDVRYIGKKKRIKRDTVNNTGVQWFGTGNVQPYPSNLASKLLVHSDVWERADGKNVNAATLQGQDHDAGDEIAKTPADPGYGTNAKPGDPLPNHEESVARQNIIRNALEMVNPATDLTEKGYPKLAVVRELSGLDDLGQKEVNALWPKSE